MKLTPIAFTAPIALIALIGSPPLRAQSLTGEVAGKNASTLRIAGGGGTDLTNFVTVNTAAMSSPWTLTLPTTGGTNTYVLQTNGSGVTSWVAQTAGFANPMTTTGDVIYSTNNSGVAGRLAIGSTGQFLQVSGGLPTWATTLGVANGGTGQITLTNHSVLIGAGTSGVTQSAVGGANTVLEGNAGADPTFGTLATDATLAGNGVGTSFGLALTHANTWTGAITENQAGIAAVYTNGLSLVNTTASLTGTHVQQSPSLDLQAHVWDQTATAADSTRDFRITDVPISSANPLVNQLVFDAGNATGGFVNQMTLTDAGNLSVATAYQVGGTTVLTSSTLGSGVTASSLTSVGTISSGTWSGTAILPAKGGTGLSTITAHGVMVGEATGNVAPTAAGTAGQVLTSGGASADPVWTTATYPSTGGTSGTILRSNGTNFLNSTATYPNTATTGDLLYASGTNTIGSLAVGTSNQVLAGGTTPGYVTLATDATMLGNGIGTTFKIDLTHANTWTGTQTFGAHAYTTNTPTALAANTNNYALLGSNSLYRISASSAVNITGIVAGSDGQIAILVNVGSNAITLTNEDPASTAGNRIHANTASNIILGADAVEMLVYDNTTARWRSVSSQ